MYLTDSQALLAATVIVQLQLTGKLPENHDYLLAPFCSIKLLII